MEFNQEQKQQVYQFISNYLENEEFRSNSQQKYDEEPSKLSILDIYALEKLLKYGNRGIYEKFLKTKGEQEKAEAVKHFDGLVKLLSHEDKYNFYKGDKGSLLPMTLLAFEVIDIAKEKQDDDRQLEYDPLNPLLYSEETEIKETIANLVFGKLIHETLALPEMEKIKNRQKNGQIANIDKPKVIEKIREIAGNDSFFDELKDIVDKGYLRVKMSLLLGRKEEIFAEYLQYNTNISLREILSMKDNLHHDGKTSNLKKNKNL